MEKGELELITVLGRDNQEITLEVNRNAAEHIYALRKDGLNVDNFTKKCHEYAYSISLSDENFAPLLELWLYHVDNDVKRYLDDSRTMDGADPWRIKRIGYSGHFEPFRDITGNENER